MVRKESVVSSVLQPWVEGLGWKMQSILMSGFRGPDFPNLYNIKAVNRWLRRASQKNADPLKDYMRQDELPTDLEVCDELEFLPAHYVHHFADSLRIVALYHPDPKTAEYAFGIHFRIAEEIFHFNIESDDTFKFRHRDQVEHK
jgi:hypothetical protein